LVLLVDDEEIVQRVFSEAFEGQSEFLLDEAHNVKEALEKLAQINYDVCFLDMKLDGNSYAGMDVLRAMNRLKIMAMARGQKFVDTRVVIMSASVPLSEVMLEANEMGVISFWQKPTMLMAKSVMRALNMIGVPILPARPKLTEPPASGTLPA
jgi:CheY-like chemotaxis protein